MNIVFWSKASGRGATSGNMLAVSIMSSIVYCVKGILVQFDTCSRPIEDIFASHHTKNFIMEEYAYYNSKGIDNLIDKSQIADISMEDVQDNIIPVKNTYMSYLPSSRRVRTGVSEKELLAGSKILMPLINKSGYYNFIDCSNDTKPLTKAIIKNADVVVINICQGMDLSDIVSDRMLMRKAVFLVGRYDSNSTENIAAIRKKYGIEKENIGAIPYNIGFHDAMEEGRVVSYLARYITSRRNDDNFDFVNNVFRSANIILRKAGFDERENKDA